MPQRYRSTGKSTNDPNRIDTDTTRLLTCDDYSALFRNNFTMLAAVFTAGFAFEMYAYCAETTARAEC